MRVEAPSDYTLLRGNEVIVICYVCHELPNQLHIIICLVSYVSNDGVWHCTISQHISVSCDNISYKLNNALESWCQTLDETIEGWACNRT